jgi:hypothetical protein
MYPRRRTAKKPFVIPPLRNPEPILEGTTVVIIKEGMAERRRELLEKRVNELGGRCVAQEDIYCVKVTHCIVDQDMTFANVLSIFRRVTRDLAAMGWILNFTCVVKCTWLTDSMKAMGRITEANLKYSFTEPLKVSFGPAKITRL